MSLKTFKRGGVHPAAMKLAAFSAIEKFPLPDKVIIPLSQHIGAPATPVVAKGDKVLVGQLIGKASGFVSANIHSSVSGTVVSLDDYTDAAGIVHPAVTIQREGDEWMPEIIHTDEIDRQIRVTEEEIVKIIGECGLVGMGGATFPTSVKLSPPPGCKAEILVVNGVECEPFLTADHRLMLEHANEIIVGVRLLMKALRVERAVIGIENNKQDAIAVMRDAVEHVVADIEVVPLEVKYPQGAEKFLIAATTGRRVPSGALPISVGAVVQNVGTVFAVYEAVMKHKPLFERVVTVTGPSLTRQANYLCRIGTPLSALLESVGGMPDDTGKIISGGPMMGRAVVAPESPVCKGSSGILVLPQSMAYRKPENECIRCGRCVQICAMGLEPYRLAMLSEHNLLDEMAAHNIMDCCECGSCSYSCPSNRPLLDLIRIGKGRTGAMLRAKAKKN